MYGIYANIWGILMGSMLPYIAYMDPMVIILSGWSEAQILERPFDLRQNGDDPLQVAPFGLFSGGSHVFDHFTFIFTSDLMLATIKGIQKPPYHWVSNKILNGHIAAVGAWSISGGQNRFPSSFPAKKLHFFLLWRVIHYTHYTLQVTNK